MSSESALITKIKATIYPNENNEIDAQKHQDLEVQIVETLFDQVESVAGGYLGTILPTDVAPTPGKNGFYKFSTAGVVSWLTGTPTVSAGDQVSVVFTDPDYTYTWLDGSLNISDALDSQDSSVAASSKAAYDLNAKIIGHEDNTENPHDVTPIQIGAASVSDLNAKMFNATTQVPLSSGYYTLTTAIAVVTNSSDVRKKGLELLFEVSANVWEVWQFKGNDSAGFATIANWELIFTSGRYGNLLVLDNLDTVAKSGNYTAYGSATGAPNSTTSWFVEHVNSSVGVVSAYQRAIAYSSDLIIYERTKIASVWGAWKQTGVTKAELAQVESDLNTVQEKTEMIGLEPYEVENEETFKVVDENGNIGFEATKDGIKTAEQQPYDSAFRLIDEAGNIGFEVDKKGKLKAVLDYDDIVNRIKANMLKDITISVPDAIYAVYNDCYADRPIEARNYIPVMHVERCLRSNYPAKFSGVSDKLYTAFLATNDYPTDIVTEKLINITFQGHFINTISKNMKIVMVKNTVLLNKTFRILAIGDSMTDAGYWFNYIFKLMEMDNVDYKKKTTTIDDIIKCKTIGTILRNNKFSDFTYRDININGTNYCEGRSGWALATYLRHAERYTWLGIDSIVWRIMGLYELYGIEFNNSTAHISLLYNTCDGQHPVTEACLNSSVWNYFKTKAGLNVEFVDATTSDKEAMMIYLTVTRLNNPKNPFYSLSKVEETKNSNNPIAFSWEAYYSRYKTHDIDGNELTEKGTSYIVNSHVAIPNYVIINLTTNDNAYGSPLEDMARDIIALAHELNLSTGSKIIICKNAATNRAFPNEDTSLPDCAGSVNLETNINGKIDDSFREILGTFSEQHANDIYYCPTYYVQRYGSNYENALYGIGIDAPLPDSMYPKLGDVHPSIPAYSDWGYELYSLICYIESF